MTQPFQVLPFASPDYQTVYQQQRDLLTQRIADEIPDTLLLGEHVPIITMGRGFHSENLMHSENIPVIEIERGGDVTYHGPGQLVGYFIFKLQPGERDVRRFLRQLEELIILTLANFELVAQCREGATGVWVGDLKIASIGVAVKKWVTWHGVALNINTDLKAFQGINPCGFSADCMTSIQALKNQSQKILPIQEKLIYHTGQVLNRELNFAAVNFVE